MIFRALLILAACFGLAFPLPAEQKPLRVLVVAGGCCHDYATQKEVLKKGIEARVNATVEVAYDPTKSTKPLFELFKSPDWGKNFDVKSSVLSAIPLKIQFPISNPASYQSVMRA